MMKPARNPSSIRFLALLAVLVLVSRQSVMVDAVTCTVTELSPCLPAIKSSAMPPSGLCCTKLKEQTPCLCGYIRNPSLAQYVNSPNARRVASACGVPIPSC